MIGIDPGVSGAIALFTPTSLQVWDMPLRQERCKNRVDGAGVYAILLALYPGESIIIEDVHSMPEQGAASTFNFGMDYGTILGVAAALQCPVFKITPSVWKGALGLSSNKKESLKLARKSFPQNLNYFSMAKHDGRAEAALLAKLGAERFNPQP